MIDFLRGPLVSCVSRTFRKRLIGNQKLRICDW
jgi:hypothetical protein